MDTPYYIFDENNDLDAGEFRIPDLDRFEYYPELDRGFSSLLDLVCGTQKDKLKKRGYTVHLNGEWGVGKTTATFALVNSLMDKVVETKSRKVVRLRTSFLPFGSTTESISAFLTKIATRLWREGMIDVRKDIGSLINELTPTIESPYALDLVLGPLRFSKRFQSARKFHDDVIDQKFLSMAEKGHLLLVILDDLDRLRPEEVVDVIRLVERLRQLAGVVTFMPCSKTIIRTALQTNGGLDPSASLSFLRKEIDYEVKIENKLIDLKSLFLKKIVEIDNNLSHQVVRDTSLTISEASWYCLLYNLVLAEAYDLGMKDAGINADLFNGKKSHFLQGLALRFAEQVPMFNQPNSPRATDPFPAHYKDAGNEFFAPLGIHYGQIANWNQDWPTTLIQLSNLRTPDNALKLVTREAGLIERMQREGRVAFDHSLEVGNAKSALLELYIPIMQSSDNETLVTDYYKLREMVRLCASMVELFEVDSLTDIGGIYRAAYKTVNMFRS